MPAPAPQPEELLNLNSFLCFAIYSANHAMNRVYKPLLEELGLTYPQYIMMVVLWEKDKQTVKSLGKQLFLESNTLTPLLKRLEKMGHITRQRDIADERQVLICLTQQGKGLKEKALKIPSCLLDATGLTPESVQHLQAQITLLRRNLTIAATKTKKAH